MKSIILNKDLKPLNSFGVSAYAERYFAFSTSSQLQDLFESDASLCNNFKVLGSGCNILLTCNPEQIIIHPENKKISFDTSSNIVYAEAGVEWDDLVKWSVERGLWGIENLSLIPGSVGAAPVQNIGAYGVELNDALHSVEVYLPEANEFKTLSKEQCRLAYRDSIFKHELKDKAIIVGVRLVLSKEGSPIISYKGLEQKLSQGLNSSLEQVREAIIQIRESKLPDPKVTGNAGSFFKNPIVELSVVEAIRLKYADVPTYPSAEQGKLKLAAGWLIDKAGWRAYRSGDVGVHHAQSLVLVNYANATGGQVLELASKICEDVENKFNVKIEMEVNLW